MKKQIALNIPILLIFIFLNLNLAMPQDESELISLDLKGMDIRDVMKILSQKSGLNIVLDNDVKGTVTLYIKDVNIRDALDIIVSTNNLSYEEDISLIRIMNEKEYEKLHGKRFKDKTITEVVKLDYSNASEVTKALSQMKTNVGKIISDDASNTIVLMDVPESIKKMKGVISDMDTPLVTEVFSLGYAKAELLKDKLEQMISKGVGSLKFDERTNRLVVKDTPVKIEDIRKVIEAFDEKTREVTIEASIIQVTLSDKYSYGIDWTAIATLGDLTIESTSNLTNSLAGTTPGTFTVMKKGGAHSSVLSLLEKFGKTNVLSRPRITVADKAEAKILVGSKEVYVTSEVTTTTGGTYHTTDNVQFVDVGVRLGVTPEINKDGYIKMKIKPEVSSTDATKTVTLTNPDSSTRAIIPYVTTSETETTVLVKDNTTLILGGLMKDTITEYNDKVPFLGGIPVLGRLFSTKGKGKEKTELVILLTPHIIEGDQNTEEAKKYIADWNKKAAEMNIEEPKEREFDLSKIMPEKKEPAQAEVAAEKHDMGSKKEQTNPKSISVEKSSRPQKTAVKKSQHPRKKWTPILSAADREVKNTETPEAKVAASPLPVNRTPYEEYYLALRQEINNLAKQDADINGIKGEVQLQFTLDKKGFLIKGPIVLNNPDLRLVRSVVKIIKKAAPFLRFPKALKQGQADFNVVIRYE